MLLLATKEAKMTNAILRRCLISALVLVSPFIYIEIQGFVTLHAGFPVIKLCSAKSKTALFFIFTTFNLLSASLTSMITALPSVYYEREHAKLITVLFAIAMLSLPTWVATQSKMHGFVGDVWLGQFVAVIVSVCVFVVIGSRIPEMPRRNVE